MHLGALSQVVRGVIFEQHAGCHLELGEPVELMELIRLLELETF